MFRKKFAQFGHSAPRPRSLRRHWFFRPHLEALEGRLVPSTVVFQDNMENGANGWVTDGSDGRWNQTANLRSNSPKTAWHYGNEVVYPDRVTPGNYVTGYWKKDPHCTPSGWDPCLIFVGTANWGTLTSPAIDLTGYSQATLTFAEWSAVEADPRYDRTIVEASADGNKFTPVFESHGTDGLWKERVVDLSAYAGKPVYVRFHFDTINAKDNGYEGWYVDDVVVSSGPALTVDDLIIREVNTGPTTANVAVRLTVPSSQAVTVDYKTANQTASAGSDYDSTSGTLTFAPGETMKTIAVPIPLDRVAEPDETFLVQLSNSANAVIADGQGQVTILDDEPRITSNGAAVTEGDSGTTDALVPVMLSAAYGETVTVHYATADDLAVAGSDYLSVNGTLSFAPGQTTQYIAVPIIGDIIHERSQEYITVNLSNPSSNAMIDPAYTAPVTVVIYDNDPLPAISISDVTKLEGTGRDTAFTFTLSLSEPSDGSVSVDVSYGGGGPSTFGPDQTYGRYTFSAGQTSLPYTIWVKGDAIKEVNESFYVNLRSPTNATIADSQGVGFIIDDDTVPALWINDVQLVEGNRGITYFVFTVTLSAPMDQQVSVNYATADGTATAGSDYKATSGTLVFAPGETTKTITVEVMGDTLKEQAESFSLNLSGATNASILDSQGLGWILNDDKK